ncbi:MAG: BPSS1780 family membrane protein [Betaproteobacteria bacterium]
MRVIDVPAKAGFAWLKVSFLLFRAQPTGWLALMAAWLLASLGLLIVPFIGGAIFGILQPGFFAGFVIAARDQEAGLPVGAQHLLAAFRFNGKPLITIGSITLLSNFLVFSILIMLGFPVTMETGAGGVPDMAGYAQSLQGKEWIIWLGLALSMVVKGVLWFTCALLALNQMPATHAIRWSFYALVANFLPMLVFALLMTAIFVIAAIPVLLGMIIAIPVFAIAHYVSYQDMFRASDEV